MERSELGRAKAAATSVAASLGLPVDDAIVVQNSNKLGLRLTPCEVFARVATVGQEVSQFEVELAQRLAEVGSPVCPLEPRVDPRVYYSDGFTVTLWTYFEAAAPDVSPGDYAKALERLHVGMREVDLPSPRFTDQITDAAEIIRHPELSPALADAERVFLGGRLEGLRRSIEGRGAPEQLLHGEPHPGNLLNTQDGPIFVDFETCCRGPVEFDLAHAPEAVCEIYPNLDQGLLDDCRELTLVLVAAWRWDIGDQFPKGRQFGEELLRALHAGRPWPTSDVMNERLEDL